MFPKPSTERVGRQAFYSLRPVKQFCEMEKIGQDPFASRVLDQALANFLVEEHRSEKSDKAGLFPLVAKKEKFLEPELPLRFP